MRKSIFLTVILLMFFAVTMSASSENKNLYIVFIGNSITFGAGLESQANDAPPASTAKYLKKCPSVGNVEISNQGVCGSTTVDFLPETNTLFKNVKNAADKFVKRGDCILVFSIMLGTNDSAIKGTNGCPVEHVQYHKNMVRIIDELLKLYPECHVVVNRPLWYSPNTHNGATYLQEGLDRLKTYYPEIKSIVKEYSKKTSMKQVYIGDTEAYGFFKKRYKEQFQAENGNSGVFYLHPNKKGAENLGNMWGKAIYKTLKERLKR